VCDKFQQLANAVPAEHYDTRHVDGVRTVADVLRHVAFWHAHVAAALRGLPGPDGNELAATDYSSKPDILNALSQHASDAGAALRDVSAGQAVHALQLIVPFLEHTSEHYGQLVVYARRAGVVPPASRE
jgi:uncharacterized damage-inducible protein DinB